MYYTNGNYNAYMKPQKPKNIDGKSAYIVGAGLAGLAAAVFLIRDGQMEGKRITIFEELPVSGGSMDAILKPERGYVMRGGREMEEHFETLWDLVAMLNNIAVYGLPADYIKQEEAFY